MPTKSRAAVLVEACKPLIVDEVTFPDPAPDQVLVKVLASGVCHSQLHQIQRTSDHPLSKLPSLLGHESTGVVAAKGRDVTHVKEGDRVFTTWIDRNAVESPLPPVSHALNMRPPIPVTWRRQSIWASASTWAEHLVASERVVVPMNDDEVDTDVTSIIGCAVITGSGAVINTLQVRPSQSVAVYGVGGIGMCAISAAAVADAYPLIAVDVDDEKLSFAKKFGASHTVNATKLDPVAAITELTGGGADFALDAVGHPTTQDQILRSVHTGAPGLSRGGTALLIGLPPSGSTPLINTNLFAGGRYFTRTHGGDCRPDRDFPTFLRWYRNGKLKLDDLVTRRYTLDQVNEAVADLEKGKILGRAIFTYS